MRTRGCHDEETGRRKRRAFFDLARVALNRDTERLARIPSSAALERQRVGVGERRTVIGNGRARVPTLVHTRDDAQRAGRRVRDANTGVRERHRVAEQNRTREVHVARRFDDFSAGERFVLTGDDRERPDDALRIRLRQIDVGIRGERALRIGVDDVGIIAEARFDLAADRTIVGDLQIEVVELDVLVERIEDVRIRAKARGNRLAAAAGVSPLAIEAEVYPASA